MSATKPPARPSAPPIPEPSSLLSRLRPHHVIAPLLLYTGACVTGPLPQSAFFLSRAEAVPGGRQIVLPPYATAYSGWQLPPESPWAAFNKSTLFASLGDAPLPAELPEVLRLAIVQRAELAATRLAALGVPEHTLLVVDLRGAASVAFGSMLSHRAGEPLAPVLTFNNWPAPHEVVPAEETLAALVTMRPRPINAADPTELSARPVFLLDAWRLAYRDAQPDDEAFDNRYALTAADLPSAAVLTAQGIQQVIYLIEQRGEDSVEEDDLHESFLAYDQAGITLHLLDLAELIDPPQVSAPTVSSGGSSSSGGRWLLRYPHRRYSPRPRSTILISPGFYRRSRGGFGGPHARPSHIPFGKRFHGPSHGGG